MQLENVFITPKGNPKGVISTLKIGFPFQFSFDVLTQIAFALIMLRGCFQHLSGILDPITWEWIDNRDNL